MYFISMFFNNILFGITDTNVKIHWFEFCINELCFKILDKKRDYLGLSELQKFRLQVYEKNHPVDHLYSEFKKLI